jgi:hypothetical protein
MNHSAHRNQAPALVAVTASETANTRLRGWRLMAARTGWLLISTALLGTYVVTLPGYEDSFAHPTPNNLVLSRGAVAALAQSGIHLSTYAWVCQVVIVLAALVAAIIGLALFWRRGEDWVALVVSLFVAIHPVGVASSALGFSGFTRLPLGWVILGVISVLESTLQFSVMLLFPSGRFVPRWSWLLVVSAGATAALGTIELHERGTSSVIALTYPTLLAPAIACMVYRYRRVSTPVQRIQTKWIIAGLIATPLCNLASWLPITFTPLGQTLYAPISFLVYLLAQVVTPLAFFVAMQRYHLYDIDTIINRALVYGSLTAILGVVYAGTVIGAQALVGAVIRDAAASQPIVLVVTTLMIAALLRPLRGWIQASVDRRFYRRKYDMSRTLEAFSATLRHETDVAALRERLLAAVDETMQPAHASLWLLPIPDLSAPIRKPAPREMSIGPAASPNGGDTSE